MRDGKICWCGTNCHHWDEIILPKMWFVLNGGWPNYTEAEFTKIDQAKLTQKSAQFNTKIRPS